MVAIGDDKHINGTGVYFKDRSETDFLMTSAKTKIHDTIQLHCQVDTSLKDSTP